ncbi:hypothetical protein L596_008920 [Steinernema carpocapsae]|uniref:Uncharacterized protein n=1 Tax=Steinernema carpocapsae TaxID=34508 RepID=A0A4U5PDV4_STECR|nr:hypothetical protein L596_008920 [Steinernema carpocapsae]
MKLAIVLCFFVALPVATAITCQDWSGWLLNVIKEVDYFGDRNLNDACDKDSKKAILEYMIDTLEILAMRLEMPCTFTFQPLPFSSTCASLNSSNDAGFYSSVGRTNTILTDMCPSGCPVEQEAKDEVEKMIQKLKNILSNL